MSAPRPKQPIRTVCLTKNSEYHLERGTCVGVRDRRSGAWLTEHQALHRMLAGALIYREGDVILCSTPTPGDHLVFEGGSAVTSAIEAVTKERGADMPPIPKNPVPDLRDVLGDELADEEPTGVLTRRAG